MIKLPRNKVFNHEFILTHQDSVRNYVTRKKLALNFFNHSFSAEEICSTEIINCISFDPFSRPSLGPSNENFLNDYQELSNFLLHGKNYLNVIKKGFSVKSGAGYRNMLKNERAYVINKFSHNQILRNIGINDPDIISSEKKYLAFYEVVNRSFMKNNQSIKAIFNYSDFLVSKKNIRNEILANIKVTICPYCNRQYIDTYSHEGNIKSIAQIDHLFPKSIFPLYSLTLLNFVPSCSYCNCIIKKDKLFPWKSFYADNTLDEQYFELIYHDAEGLYGKSSGFDLTISATKKEDLDHANFFRHKEIYKNHKEDITSILKKRLTFTSGYKKSLEEVLSKEITNAEFKFMIFGVTGEPEDYLTIPLSKLKNDILKYQRKP
ncbi:hypothetical protein [Klebsiella sp. JB_Kp017]|uniref:hypothetical protein n=1 Tax=Klebsiella sp. JB_Kp017 TaxID=3153369 RepID=UPI0032B35860